MALRCHQAGGVRHFKYSIFAEINKRLQFLFIAALRHNRIEEGSLRLLDLRLLPLLNVGVLNFEIDSFDALRAAHNFDAPQKRFEIVQYGAGRFQEACETRLIRHMLRQVGQQYGQIETDFGGRLMESIGEPFIVDFAIVIDFHASDQELDLFAAILKRH